MTATATVRAPEQVREFLLANRDFFLEHPDLLLQLNFPHDTGGAVSLIERQVERLREELAIQRQQTKDLSKTAEANHQLFRKFANLLVTLAASKNASELLQSFSDELVQHFDLQQVLVMLPPDTTLPTTNAVLVLTPEDMQKLSTQLLKLSTYVGRTPPALLDTLKLDAETVGSIGLVRLPLQDGLGYFCLVSKDAKRFQADMATDFIEILASLLASLLEQRR